MKSRARKFAGDAGGLLLNGNVASVRFLAVDDLNHVGQQQRIALFVELERAANAVEAYFTQRVANGRLSSLPAFSIANNAIVIAS